MVVSVGDHVSSGAVLYTEFKPGYAPAQRSIARGSGVIAYGPQQGQVTAGVAQAGSFWVLPADGGRLQAGTYPDTLRPSGQPPQSGLMGFMACTTLFGMPVSDVSGSFEVRDVAYAGDGTIARLAIDFEEHCVTGDEYRRSSYRFNSAMPLRP
jgi:hypothetical protein